MKVKTAIFVLLTVVAGLFVCYQTRFAQAQTESAKSSQKIAVVNIQKVFQESKKVAKYKEDTMTERSRIEAELDKRTKEIEAEKAGLKTLKPDSNDYMTQVREILTKQANSQAQEKFYEQQMTMKEQQMVERIYTDILHQVKKVAEEKGFDIVLDKTEVNFPAMSLNDATMMVRTNKVLYSSGCPDITADVVAAMDKESPGKDNADKSSAGRDNKAQAK